jgi:hypothetical protein
MRATEVPAFLVGHHRGYQLNPQHLFKHGELKNGSVGKKRASVPLPVEASTSGYRIGRNLPGCDFTGVMLPVYDKGVTLAA